jgi:signal transduction histidine kinase/PAS domain-containing protein
VRRWLVSNSYYPRWFPQRLRHPSAGYLVAAALQMLALLADSWLVHVLPYFEFAAVLNVLAIVLVALTWGAGPSLLATIVAMPILNVALFPPQSLLALPSGHHAAELSLFAFVGGVVTLAAAASERARSAAERSALIADTARRMAEDLAMSLAAERARLDAVIQAVPDVVSIHDAAGTLVKLNSAGQRLAALGEVLPPTGHGTETAGLRTLDDEPLADDQTPLARALRGEIVTGAEVHFTAPAGETRSLSVSAAPLRDAQGRVAGAVTAARDISERVRFERRARASLRALLDVAEALVSIPGSDLSDEQDERSESLVTSRRLAEIICHLLNCRSVLLISIDPATQMQHIVASAGRDGAGQLGWHAFVDGNRTGRVLTAAELRQMRDGEVIAPSAAPSDLPTLLAPMRVGDDLVGMMALAVDDGLARLTVADRELIAAAGSVAALVIERVRLLRERASAQARAMALQQAGERMDEFLAIASHEIKTPLTTVKASAQLIKRRLPRGDEAVDAEELADLLATVRRELPRIDRQSQRLTRLVQDLLDASRARARSLALRPVACDLVALVDECVRDQRGMEVEQRIVWTPPAVQPLTVDADPDRVAQVVTNYLSNALKYSPPEQPVTIAVQRDDHSVIVRVSDRGPGLPAAERERVWDRFYQVQGISVLAGSGVGLGLGLFICRSIVEGHGGSVGVESEPGQGSTFWFSLPLAHSTQD